MKKLLLILTKNTTMKRLLYKLLAVSIIFSACTNHYEDTSTDSIEENEGEAIKFTEEDKKYKELPDKVKARREQIKQATAKKQEELNNMTAEQRKRYEEEFSEKIKARREQIKQATTKQ